MPGRHKQDARFQPRDSRHHRSGIGWRSLAIAATVVIFGVVSVSGADASVFKPGEKIGDFKVLGGHFSQQVNYLADYKLQDTANACYVYKFSDKGNYNYDLTFDKGQVSPLKYSGKYSFVDFRHELRLSGKVSAAWEGQVAIQPGPGYDDSCAPPVHFGHAPQSCATTLKGVDSFPSGLIPTDGGTASRSGDDAALDGPILFDPPFGCPSDSTYGIFALTAGSSNGMRQLDNAKVGDTVKLNADSSITSSDPLGFNVLWKFTSGSQHASDNWSLKLKRVKKRS